MTTRAYGVALTLLVVGCEPNLVVGVWDCPKPADEGGTGSLPPPLVSPWSTGFEDGFCGYKRAGGHCYAGPSGSFDTVTSPVHSGTTAAAFSISTSGARDSGQTRCFLRGELPEDAYYGAWYFIPSAASDPDNWNLFHFRTGDATRVDGRWDVTITTAPDGSLRFSVLDFFDTSWHHATGVPPVPIGSWFHLQFHWRRSATATGAFALYQDGVMAVGQEGVVTDVDSTVGEWYVGNLAIALTPPELTVYVDDVTMTPEL